MAAEYAKPIHITKLWVGAVFSLVDNSPVVWYHVDFINDKVIHFTAMHNHKDYEKKLYDRYVWLRVSKPTAETKILHSR